MRIFLTGGTGFIGSHVAMELLKGELGDTALLARLVEGKDACVHIALNYTRKLGWEVLADDTLPTVFLSDAAAEAGVGHFVYTSSTAANDSVYTGPVEDRDHAALVTATSKQHPATFYGATKAASENFLIARSHLSAMRVNVVRPGYAFGNPALEGGSMEGDGRFSDIAAAAGEPISVVKHDGTQFIYAGDLALLYARILASEVNRKTYFGLSKNFVSWEAIAREAVRRCSSSSPILVEDRGYEAGSSVWDVSDMKADFGLEFDPWPRIREHLDYLIALARTRSGKPS